MIRHNLPWFCKPEITCAQFLKANEIVCSKNGEIYLENKIPDVASGFIHAIDLSVERQTIDVRQSIAFPIDYAQVSRASANEFTRTFVARVARG